MKKTSLVLLTTVIFFASVFLLFQSQQSGKSNNVRAQAINRVLRVHLTNPRYFTDDSDKAIYLTGSHTWYNIQQSGNDPSAPNNLENFKIYLDFMQDHNHNFTRLWTAFSYLNSDMSPYPWQRTGPGLASDDQLKFDMTKFNQSYFDNLRSFLTEMQNRGMYASVMFFGSHNGFKNFWDKIAWNSDNNVNAELKSLNEGNDFVRNPDIDVKNIQKLTIRKFIDELNDYDNIIWEIMNEASDVSVNWQYEMINYAKQYEFDTYGTRHLIGMTGGYLACMDHACEDSPADYISPDNYCPEYYDLSTEDSDGGPAEYDDKIVILDTDHLWGFTESTEIASIRKWVWKTFLRGNHPIYMDNYDDKTWGSGIPNQVNTWEEPARLAMGYTRAYALKFTDLAAMLPSSSTADCSTAYCLRNAGKEYLVYQPNSGAFTVNLPVGSYSYEWFNPNTGTITSTSTKNVTAQDNISFTPPFLNDAVLYIKIADQYLKPDINQDSIINLQDFNLFKSYFQSQNIIADFNHDQKTNTQDLGIMMNVWGAY